MTDFQILAVIVPVAVFFFGAGFVTAAIKCTPEGVWCKAGKHFFANWKPCPCCIGEMVAEYKTKVGE